MKYRVENKGYLKEQKKQYYDDIRKHALVCLRDGKIKYQQKWDVFCNQIKHCSKKHPYSADFTNETMFDMMSKGCFYCGNTSTTIDRIDSTLDHTPDNCIGCCQGCNNSKGAADYTTFVRKAYYRSRGKYADDVVDIWFVHKQKPRMDMYKKSAENKGVPFDITKGQFDELIKGDCKYCHRSPSSWFGIDRVVPNDGYVNGNVVSCCYDCNVDKHINDADTTLKRNEQIAERVDSGYLFVDTRPPKTIHIGNNPRSKKVCVYGKIYENKREASRVIGKTNCYVSGCIIYGRHPDDIFEISDQFYEEYKDSENITKTMFIGFDHYYTNM